MSLDPVGRFLVNRDGLVVDMMMEVVVLSLQPCGLVQSQKSGKHNKRRRREGRTQADELSLLSRDRSRDEGFESGAGIGRRGAG